MTTCYMCCTSVHATEGLFSGFIWLKETVYTIRIIAKLPMALLPRDELCFTSHASAAPVTMG